MSGGIAYVYDQQADFKDRCNMEMVELEDIAADDETVIYILYATIINIRRAMWRKGFWIILSSEIKNFVKVMPIEYKRILETEKLEKKLDLET